MFTEFASALGSSKDNTSTQQYVIPRPNELYLRSRKEARFATHRFGDGDLAF